MTLQNRVLPTGDIVATPARGTMMGNRGGAIHRSDQTLGHARWRSRAWICCLLSFKGRRRPVMALGQYTELFFLDEAVALSAGHRPCAECRRAAFTAFQRAWADAGLGDVRAPEMDAVLHPVRRARDATGATHRADAARLPPGTFALIGAAPALILQGRALPFTPAGYGPPQPRPSGDLAVLTPAPIVAVLAQGYAPMLHPTARA